MKTNAKLEFNGKKITVKAVNIVTSATGRIQHPKEGQGFLHVTGTDFKFPHLNEFLSYDKIFLCIEGVTIIYELFYTTPEEAVKSFLKYCLEHVV